MRKVAQCYSRLQIISFGTVFMFSVVAASLLPMQRASAASSGTFSAIAECYERPTRGKWRSSTKKMVEVHYRFRDIARHPQEVQFYWGKVYGLDRRTTKAVVSQQKLSNGKWHTKHSQVVRTNEASDFDFTVEKQRWIPRSQARLAVSVYMPTTDSPCKAYIDVRNHNPDHYISTLSVDVKKSNAEIDIKCLEAKTDNYEKKVVLHYAKGKKNGKSYAWPYEVEVKKKGDRYTDKGTDIKAIRLTQYHNGKLMWQQGWSTNDRDVHAHTMNFTDADWTTYSSKDNSYMKVEVYKSSGIRDRHYYEPVCTSKVYFK